MHRVTIEASNLRFSAAHFITCSGKCERLHGHNYAVSVSLEGSLTGDGLVFDFVELKRVVRGLCEGLDHRFLLPRLNTRLEIGENGGEVEIRFKDRRYVLPQEDVLDLPLDNITAERLAGYIAGELAAVAAAGGNISLIEVGVEESPGQTAYYRQALETRTPFPAGGRA